MNGEDLDYVRGTIEGEGFHYAFIDYSDFKHIEDEEFHRLRKAYVEATEALSKFLNLAY